jgi:TPR repeat protein
MRKFNEMSILRKIKRNKLKQSKNNVKKKKNQSQYLYGISVYKEYIAFGEINKLEEALRVLEKFALLGDRFSQEAVGDLLFYKAENMIEMTNDTELNEEKEDLIYKEANNTFEKSYNMYIKAAKNGSIYSKCMVAKFLINADYVERDIDVALKYLYEAFKFKNEEAAYILGQLSYFGNWIEKDRKKSIEYLKIASDNGHCDAMLLLGHIYYEGTDIEKNVEKAMKLFENSTEEMDEISYIYLFHNF